VTDPCSLKRFQAAQDKGGTYRRAVSELRAGRKASHWMWFVFPQLRGLGQSATSKAYAISSLAEARAYLEHPVLGPRLVQCARILAELQGQSAQEILGATDAMKLRSSMTLFATAAPGEEIFAAVLTKYFDGLADTDTQRRLEARQSGGERT
jgi:uncharacterized protein (DUF1810 family)